jgi:hypothetical protein
MILLTFLRKWRTEWYVKTFLVPKAKLAFPTRRALRSISSRWLLDVDTIYLRVRSMRYSDFLKTPYWMTLSAEIRRRARGKCRLCRRKTDRLQVHHINYVFHGMEHLRWKDRKFLIPICPDCHRMQGARREREA